MTPSRSSNSAPIELWFQCRRCGLLTTNRYGGGEKCHVFPGDYGLRDHHDLESVRVEIRVLDDVLDPEFAADRAEQGGVYVAV